MKGSLRREIETLLAAGGDPGRGSVISVGDIAMLPPPVQRYMRYSNVIGKRRISSVRLKQKGYMRMNPDGNWIPLEAEEYYTVDPPAFIWYGRAKMMPLVSFDAVDRYVDNSGRMQVKLLSFVKMVDAAGPELDQGAMMRFLNEMIWFPTAYLSEMVEWESIDDDRAQALFTFGSKKVSAEFHFDELGRVTNFVADRYRSVGKDFVLEKWSTPLNTYAEFHGINLPVTGEAVWHLDSGEFSYIKLEITGIEYDNPSGYWQG